MSDFWRKRVLMIVVDGLAGMGAAGVNQAGLSEGVAAVAAIGIVCLVSAPLKEPIRAHAFLSLCFFCLGLAILR